MVKISTLCWKDRQLWPKKPVSIRSCNQWKGNNLVTFTSTYKLMRIVETCNDSKSMLGPLGTMDEKMVVIVLLIAAKGKVPTLIKLYFHLWKLRALSPILIQVNRGKIVRKFKNLVRKFKNLIQPIIKYNFLKTIMVFWKHFHRYTAYFKYKFLRTMMVFRRHFQRYTRTTIGVVQPEVSFIHLQ